MRKNEYRLFQTVQKDSFERHDIGITVTRYVTDVSGLVIDKNLLPVNMRVAYPFALFGEFDRQGGYYGAQSVNPPKGASKLLTNFVVGNGFGSFSITGFSGLSTIQNFLFLGDIVSVYTDDLSTPSFFVWVVINYRGYSFASLMNNTKTQQKDYKIGRLYVDSINYLADQVKQYNEGWKMLRYDNLGMYDKNDLQPLTIRTPQDFLNDLVIINIKFLIDQYIQIASYLQFDTNQISLTFNIKKITND